MRWQQATLVAHTEAGRDELGNPVYEQQELGTFPARLTAWNASEQQSLGREYTMTHRRLLTPTDIAAFRGQVDGGERRLTTVQLGGVTYRVTKLLDYNRIWSVVHLEASGL